MRKNFYLSGLFLSILALCVCGCGGGSAADPMGTATVRFVDESGSIISSTSVGVNGTITLRIKVTNTRSDGTAVPVVNEQVSFVIVNSGNGGSLTVSNDHTGSDGTATALFKSGNSMYSDNVRVTTEAGSTASIYINKTGGLTEPSIKTIAASSPSVVAGQTSVITVNIADGAGGAVMGVLVTFTIPVNGSGAVFSYGGGTGLTYSTYTDVGGNATAVYKAGGVDPYNDAYDSVMAEISGTGYYSSKAVDIKRTAGTAPPPTTDLSVTLAAAPTSVAASQTSIITATVAGDNKSGAGVTFTIPVNASGASFITNSGASVPSITVTASGTGIATALYQAGTLSPGVQVQDTVQAVLSNGANAAVILTRTSTTTSYYAVSITPSSASVTAGQVSIITATVTITSGTTTTNAGGVTVSFTLPVNSSGATLTPTTATTDSSGKAVVIYQPGATSPAVTVQDTVQAAIGTATSAVAITRTGSSTSAFSIAVVAAPATLATATSNSIITANVKNNLGTVVSGVTVNFVATKGTVAGSATTDGSGNAVVTYSGDGVAGVHTGVVTASISVGGNTYTAAAVINYPASSSSLSITVAPSPPSVTAGQMSIITATLTGDNNAGITVIFSLPASNNNSGATLSAAAATTDGSGKAVVIYTPGALTPTLTVQDTVQATVGTATAATVVTRVGSAASAYGITLTPSTSTLPLIGGGSSVLTAKVTNSTGVAISGVTVTFSFTAGDVVPLTAITDGSGNAVTVFTAGAGATKTTAGIVTASITISGNTYTAAVIITYP